MTRFAILFLAKETNFHMARGRVIC